MTIDISYNEKEQFVLVKTTGDYSIEDVDDFLRKAADFAKSIGCSRILLDHRGCKFTAGTLGIHQVTKYLEGYGFDGKLKGAVVYDQDAEKYRFADTVSQNWSMGMLRFFNDCELAKTWLLE